MERVRTDLPMGDVLGVKDLDAGSTLDRKLEESGDINLGVTVVLVVRLALEAKPPTPVAARALAAD